MDKIIEKYIKLDVVDLLRNLELPREYVKRRFLYAIDILNTRFIVLSKTEKSAYFVPIGKQIIDFERYYSTCNLLKDLSLTGFEHEVYYNGITGENLVEFVDEDGNASYISREEFKMFEKMKPGVIANKYKFFQEDAKKPVYVVDENDNLILAILPVIKKDNK